MTEAYGKGCVITDEHSLPALEAAHIKAYAAGGPHEVCNGLLLRADLHLLFDQSYITVTPDRRVEISRRLRADFANGRSYYPYHGYHLRGPASAQDQPLGEYLQWHKTTSILAESDFSVLISPNRALRLTVYGVRFAPASGSR